MLPKTAASIGSAVFLAVAPGLVAGLAPYWISRWRLAPAFFGWRSFRVAGVVLIAAGAAVLLDSFARFAVQGLGTPAPVIPTRRLVVSGLYRHVRNPMYVAVVAAIVGQALLLGNRAVLEYGVVVSLLCHLFVVVYEEPTLVRTFGSEYRHYRAAVPRWIPRLTAMRQSRD